MAVTRRLVLLSSLFLLSCIDGAKADTCKYGVTTINGDTPYYEMYKHCPSECCQSDCCGPPKPFSGLDIEIIVGLVLGGLAFCTIYVGIHTYCSRRRKRKLREALMKQISRDLVNLAFENPLGPGAIAVNRDTKVSSSSPSHDQPQSNHNVQSVTSPPGRDGDE